MAMNAAALKAALLSDFNTKLRPKFENLDDDHELTGLDFNTIWGIISEVIAETIIAHIQTNARCNGTDSNGDTHGNVQIT